MAKRKNNCSHKFSVTMHHKFYYSLINEEHGDMLGPYWFPDQRQCIKCDYAEYKNTRIWEEDPSYGRPLGARK